MHNGIDIVPIASYEGRRNYAVIAIAKGRVAYARYNGDFGNIVVVDHGHDCSSGYAHLAYLLVGEGAQVNAGTTLGYFADMTPDRFGEIVESTGNATTQGRIVRNHLHFFMFTAPSNRRLRPPAIPGRMFVDPSALLKDGFGFRQFAFEPPPLPDRSPSAMQARFANAAKPLPRITSPPVTLDEPASGAPLRIDDSDDIDSTSAPAAPTNLRIIASIVQGVVNVVRFPVRALFSRR